MFIAPLFRVGIPQDAPTLTITSGSSDHTPDFVLTGDLALADTVRFSYSTDIAFAGASEITNTIDAGEDAANSLDFSTGSLANGTWYFRARIERPPRGVTAWSNSQSITLTGSNGGPISLMGSWMGGFGGPSGAGAGPISMLGFWMGGLGAAPSQVTGHGQWDWSDPLFYEWWRRKTKKVEEATQPAAIEETIEPIPQLEQVKPIARSRLSKRTIEALAGVKSLDDLQSLDVRRSDKETLAAVIREFEKLQEEMRLQQEMDDEDVMLLTMH